MNFVEKYIKENKLLLEGIAITAGLVALFLQVEDDNAKIFSGISVIILIVLTFSLGAKTVRFDHGENFIFLLTKLAIFGIIGASLFGLLVNLYLIGVYYYL